MSDNAELKELLRRTHREELLPVAQSLGVNPLGLGFGSLVSAIERTARQKGAHVLANVFARRGEGPGWPDVVRGLAIRQKIDPKGTTEEVELRILRIWLERNWATLPPEHRARAWGTLGQEQPPPDDGAEALAKAAGSRSFPYFLTQVASQTVGRIAFMSGCFLIWYLGKPDDTRVLAAVAHIAQLRQALRLRVTIGVVGSPSSGKDAAMKALFGVDHGNISPIAGSTKEVAITRIPDATATWVVNTPGMGDVVQAVTEEARQVLDHIDVFLYLVNAQGGVQAREKADHALVKAYGRPVLVVLNKIDTLKEADRARLIEDTRVKLGLEDREIVGAAFDPLPQLADAPIGLDLVQGWVSRTLGEAGKDITELPWNRA